MTPSTPSCRTPFGNHRPGCAATSAGSIPRFAWPIFRRGIFVFASLVKESLLQIDELVGLDAEKLAKIAAMSRF